MMDLTIPALLTAAFWAWILMWAVKLEKKDCPCARDWRLQYVKYFAAVTVAFQLIIMTKQRQLLFISAPIMGLAGMVFVAATISYVISQRRKKCACSVSTDRGIIFGFAILQAVIIVSALAGYGVLKGMKKV
jgi:hypothetical protein